MKPFHYKQDPLYNAAAAILQGKLFEAEQPQDQALTEETMSKGLLKNVLRVMETQRFSDWYKEDFEGYITGDPDAKTEEEILDDLENLIKNGYPMR
jgi:hypothetical protein